MTLFKTSIIGMLIFLTSCSASKKTTVSNREYMHDRKSGEVFINGEKKYMLTSTSFLGEGTSLYSIETGEELIFYRTVVPNNGLVSLWNDQGSLENRYIEMKFLGLNKKIEIANNFDRNVILMLDRNEVVKNGSLDVGAVDLLIEKYGEDFYSSRLNQNNNRVILID